MIKRLITYTNPFTNKEETEEHYFHISKADLIEMEMEEHNLKYEKDGETLTGLQAKLQKIVDSEDGKAIIAAFEDILRRAYGKKEGDHFRKSKEIWDDFRTSEAYSQLIFELYANAGDAAEFFTQIIPSDLDQVVEDITKRAEETEQETEATVTALSDRSKEVRVLTQDEVATMDPSEFKAGIAEGRYKLS